MFFCILLFGLALGLSGPVFADEAGNTTAVKKGEVEKTHAADTLKNDKEKPVKAEKKAAHEMHEMKHKAGHEMKSKHEMHEMKEKAKHEMKGKHEMHEMKSK